MKIKFTLLILIIAPLVYGQSNRVTIQSDIKLPKDSIAAEQIIESLNGFLELKDKPNRENTFVLKEDLPETSILLDEMKGIEIDSKSGDSSFYKCYLTNIVQTDDGNYLIQFSYIGVKENIPVLAASFEVVGKKSGNQFYFTSPLRRNTLSRNFKQINNGTFRFKNILNESSAADFVITAEKFDDILNVKGAKIEWYGCDDMPEMLRIIGVLYKAEYNGRKYGSLYANENNTTIIVSGSNDSEFRAYDPHDLFHDRARIVIPADKYNHYMVCGCAYLYGGSWGIKWQQIVSMFNEKMTSDPDADWLKLYTEGYNFGESKEKHLLVTQYINALILRKTEREKGNLGVMDLLSSGNQKKDPETFFKILEKVTGINKTNFNEKVWELIKDAK
ncbi:MAG: hypothetical protein PHN88_03540 [Ignavibacteria bacterium]|nr:hypothetical protein [Ignavibacteria bacterium]